MGGSVPDTTKCRLAFHGTVAQAYADAAYATTALRALKVFKIKHRDGHVDRLVDERTVLGRGLFKRETAMDLFLGLPVELSTGTAPGPFASCRSWARSPTRGEGAAERPGIPQATSASSSPHSDRAASFEFG